MGKLKTTIALLLVALTLGVSAQTQVPRRRSVQSTVQNRNTRSTTQRNTRSTTQTNTRTTTQSNTRSNTNSTLTYRNQVAQERVWRPKGYRGFVDVSSGYELESGGVFANISTTHGFQINPRIFVGGGVGLNFISGSDSFAFVPVYADFRFTFLRSRITPYLDLRGGTCLNTEEGQVDPYVAPTFGCHFSFKERFALNAGFGFDLMFGDRYYRSYSEKKALPAFSFRVGLEW